MIPCTTEQAGYRTHFPTVWQTLTSCMETAKRVSSEASLASKECWSSTHRLTLPMDTASRASAEFSSISSSDHSQHPSWVLWSRPLDPGTRFTWNVQHTFHLKRSTHVSPQTVPAHVSPQTVPDAIIWQFRTSKLFPCFSWNSATSFLPYTIENTFDLKQFSMFQPRPFNSWARSVTETWSAFFFYEAIFLLLFFTWIKLTADFFMSDKNLKKVFGKSE